jgi:copper chaperone CopZ
MTSRHTSNETGTLSKASLAIRGMTCSGCAGRVQRALSEQAGVSQAAVDLAGARAEIFFDQAQTDPASLAEVVRRTGYDAEVTQSASGAAGV